MPKTSSRPFSVTFRKAAKPRIPRRKPVAHTRPDAAIKSRNAALPVLSWRPKVLDADAQGGFRERFAEGAVAHDRRGDHGGPVLRPDIAGRRCGHDQQRLAHHRGGRGFQDCPRRGISGRRAAQGASGGIRETGVAIGRGRQSETTAHPARCRRTRPLPWL